MNRSYITGSILTHGTEVPVVSTVLNQSDFRGAVMVRWGINREHYRVEPGLYAAGNPGPESDVFVTANYKLSFDHLRKNLEGINSWILVLDTRGVNVWCAAGKGTFSTKELVKRINSVSLDKIVSHRRLILPQLGATGVAAHKVKEESGFNVSYGPVRAADIKKFIAGRYRADREMRKVGFEFRDRIKLIPNDFVYGKFYLLGAMAVLFLVSAISRNGISVRNFADSGLKALFNVFLAYFAGIVLTPMLLPWLPGRYFSLKGFFSGLLAFAAILLISLPGFQVIEKISWFFIVSAISSFLAMNFTGSSTYTSLSGVKKEMKISLPFQISFASVGLALNIVGKII